MEALALVALAVVVIGILMAAVHPPRHANHAGLRFEVEEDEDADAHRVGVPLSPGHASPVVRAVS